MVALTASRPHGGANTRKRRPDVPGRLAMLSWCAWPLSRSSFLEAARRQGEAAQVDALPLRHGLRDLGAVGDHLRPGAGIAQVLVARVSAVAWRSASLSRAIAALPASICRAWPRTAAIPAGCARASPPVATSQAIR